MTVAKLIRLLQNAPEDSPVMTGPGSGDVVRAELLATGEVVLLTHHCTQEEDDDRRTTD